MKYGRVTEKQVKEMQRKINTTDFDGVCHAVQRVLGRCARYEWIDKFLPPSKYGPLGFFCWPLTPAGDRARKRFIRTLKGKRYPK